MRIAWVALGALVAGCSSSGKSDDEVPAEDRETAEPAMDERTAWEAACAISEDGSLREVEHGFRWKAAAERAEEVAKHPAVTAVLGGLIELRAGERTGHVAAAASAAGVTDCHLVAYMARGTIEHRCEAQGDARACAEAATLHAETPLFDDQPERAETLRELACTHGDGASCAALAGDSARARAFHGMACRRGHTSSCAKAGPSPHFPTFEVDIEPAASSFATKITRVYQAGIEDCLVEMRDELSRKGRARLRVAIDYEATGEIETRGPPPLTSCLKEAASTWRFPFAPGKKPDALAVTVTWEKSPTAEEVTAAVNEEFGSMFSGEEATGAESDPRHLEEAIDPLKLR